MTRAVGHPTFETADGWYATTARGVERVGVAVPFPSWEGEVGSAVRRPHCCLSIRTSLVRFARRRSHPREHLQAAVQASICYDLFYVRRVIHLLALDVPTCVCGCQDVGSAASPCSGGTRGMHDVRRRDT